MIQIEKVHIQELRGIRKLTLNMDRKNFVISGPNGSGKSGVVDAIQFALTGEISRLTGTGTGEVSLGIHGPHVNKRDSPDTAQVRLDVYLPGLSKSASITRRVKTPKKPKIEPSDPDIIHAFAEAATHPEVILSRREIIRFILTEATKRSKDVQTLLKLESIDDIRTTLKTAENRLASALANATSMVNISADSLRRHVDIPALKNDEVLDAINRKRLVLNLEPLNDLQDSLAIKKGVVEEKDVRAEAQTKETCLRDIAALKAALEDEAAGRDSVEKILKGAKRLEEQPELLGLLHRRPFLVSGFDLVDEAACPLCDTSWEIEALRAHVQRKIDACDDAQAVKNELTRSGQLLRSDFANLQTLAKTVQQIKEVDAKLLEMIANWTGYLSSGSSSLNTVEGILSLQDKIRAGWKASPEGMFESLEALAAAVTRRPAKTETDNATEFLFVAKERLEKYQEAKRIEQRKKLAAARGKAVYETYCEISEAHLLSLYDNVQEAFADNYRLINEEDEGAFVAKLEPEQGKLGLLVDFYEKGMFPPAAYHSEGHQDGMGLCLYLALTSHVLKESFSLAVLDDVVMSVDSRHRKQVCKLLNTKFSETQFIITTHDRVWAEQIRHEGLVTKTNAVAFHSWTVDTGPILEEVTEVWEKIDQRLIENEVPSAAHLLRRHMEFVSNQLADELGARVSFRGDGSYDMGDLLDAVIGKQGDLLKKADEAARSWKNDEAIEKVQQLRNRRSEIMAASNGEQWVINKVVHFNEWADLSVDDFKPVVNAFRDLLGQFRCDSCDSWVAPTPRKNSSDLRCRCGLFHLNLLKK